jgi:hypothetical protein
MVTFSMAANGAEKMLVGTVCALSEVFKMRLGWFEHGFSRHSLGSALALTALLGGCSTSNEGNVTTPPPPKMFQAAPAPTGGGGSGGSGGGPSVIPKGNLEVIPSTGCGKPPPAGQVQSIPDSRTGYTEYFVTQTGANLVATDPTTAGERQYFVRLPADYDQAKPYRIVYVGQGCGALRAGRTNTYALFDTKYGGTDDAIYVGVSVPDNDRNPGCYDNNSGPESQEWEAFDLMHTAIEASFCVDNNRIFVAGYSTGGWLSNMWGCYFGGVKPDRKFAPDWAIRGHVNVTGSLPPNQPVPCNGPSAGLWIHDSLDKSNLIATNIAALELNLTTNGCTGNYKDGPKEPWSVTAGGAIPGLAGDVCQEYTGCSEDMRKNYPLVFCTTNGEGHGDQPKNAIPAFTQFFDLLNPAQQ